MIAPARHMPELPLARCVTLHLSRRRVRSWTGRSVVVSATETHQSRLSTAGTRLTRVSAMRLPLIRVERIALQRATFATSLAPLLRRVDPGPAFVSG